MLIILGHEDHIAVQIFLEIKFVDKHKIIYLTYIFLTDFKRRGCYQFECLFVISKLSTG